MLRNPATPDNPVNERIGRRRKIIAQPKSNAERRKILEVANRLSTERDWRGDLARSVKEVIDFDDFGTMDPIIREKWVKALCSGEYQQCADKEVIDIDDCREVYRAAE